MSFLIPIQYHKRNYPFGISPAIKEAAAHFDIERIKTNSPCSLHTEYSYRRRNLSSPIIKRLPTIRASHKGYVPRLWFNEKWAQEFADFIMTITRSSDFVRIIEIHPPFDDYCGSLEDFIQIYRVFEDRILSVYPEIEILIENRYGTTYRGGKFLLSTNNQILKLSDALARRDARLGVVLDLPQLFTAHFKSMEFTEKEVSSVLNPLHDCRDYIRGLHIWGKRRSESGRWISHVGNLNTYFDDADSRKKSFLNGLYNLLNDQRQRYFVPEVNSSDDDLKSIVTDLRDVGFQFLSPAQ